MKLACLQTEPGPDPAANLDRLARAARAATAWGADLLVTPEMFLTGYNIGAEAAARLAEPSDGAMAGAVAGIAQEAGIALLYGYPEADRDAVYNAVQLIDRHGARQGNYRKTHLYGEVDRAQFAPGPSRPPVVTLEGWRLGLAICYDIEFPELARALALDGAELILVPTANMVPFDSVATRLVPARAEENALFVAYANYCGAEGDFTYCGQSCITGPDGRDLARAGPGEVLILARLDRAAISRTRAGATHLNDLRPELYGPAE